MSGLAPAQAAQGDLIEIAWSPEGTFEQSVHVEPKRFVEVCGKLPASAAVQWRFESRAALDFNIHFHEGKVVRYPARQNAIAKAAGTLHAPAEQDYCWMWTNKPGKEAAMSFGLRRR